MVKFIKQKILITGSSGFIGRSLKNFLEKKGVEVISYDKKDDILDFDNLKSKIKGVAGIVHLAAMSQPKSTFENPQDCVNINIGGTINVLEAIRSISLTQSKPPWMIFISSREVFGKVKILPVTEKTPRKPASIYGITKLAGEYLCRAYSDVYGLKTRIIMFTSVYGGKNDKPDRVIPKFIISAVKNEPLTIYGTGREIFDFTHINDASEGVWGCIKELKNSPKLHDDFIISFGEPVNLNELAGIIIRETKSKSKIKYVIGPSYSANRCYANCRKAKKILGFKPKIDIKKGIKLSIKL